MKKKEIVVLIFFSGGFYIIRGVQSWPVIIHSIRYLLFLAMWYEWNGHMGVMKKKKNLGVGFWHP